ncbi:uncharacterized protein [Panulirus ornatus]|uniref:uncharacterized protein n=1 Tax=Panulirus ornatus TaxID=150431 RepID=UPI003A851D52
MHQLRALSPTICHPCHSPVSSSPALGPRGVGGPPPTRPPEVWPWGGPQLRVFLRVWPWGGLQLVGSFSGFGLGEVFSWWGLSQGLALGRSSAEGIFLRGWPWGSLQLWVVLRVGLGEVFSWWGLSQGLALGRSSAVGSFSGFGLGEVFSWWGLSQGLALGRSSAEGSFSGLALGRSSAGGVFLRGWPLGGLQLWVFLRGWPWGGLQLWVFLRVWPWGGLQLGGSFSGVGLGEVFSCGSFSEVGLGEVFSWGVFLRVWPWGGLQLVGVVFKALISLVAPPLSGERERCGWRSSSVWSSSFLPSFLPRRGTSWSGRPSSPPAQEVKIGFATIAAHAHAFRAVASKPRPRLAALLLLHISPEAGGARVVRTGGRCWRVQRWREDRWRTTSTHTHTHTHSSLPPPAGG